MNAPAVKGAQPWSPNASPDVIPEIKDAIEDVLTVPATRQLALMRSTFDARLDALERALDDAGQAASLPALVLALAGAAADEAEAAMKQACLDVRREADRVVSELQHAMDSLRLELDRERLAHAQARTAALQAEQRMSDLETRAAEHEAVRVQLEQARHDAEVNAATAIEDAARVRAEQDAAHARAVAEKAAAHARDLAERDAAHARAIAERDAAHTRAVVERDAKHAHAVAVLEQRLTSVETDAQARASREDQARRRLENQCREVEGHLAVMSRDRDHLASETAQLRLEIEVMRQFVGAGGTPPRGAAVSTPPTAVITPPAAVTASPTAVVTLPAAVIAQPTAIIEPPAAVITRPIERSSVSEEGSSSVFSSVADALRAWSAEGDATPYGLSVDARASSGASLAPSGAAYTPLTQSSPVHAALSRPVRVRIGRDVMHLVEMTRGGGEVVAPVELPPGRHVMLVFITSPDRAAVTAHVSWCRLEPPSAGDGVVQYRAGLSFELDPQTFDRLSSAPEA
jgi:hypothetical protein